MINDFIQVGGVDEIIVFQRLTPSKLQTKDWRKNQGWYKGGKKNECEKYQIRKIEKIIKTKYLKTNNDRINTKTLQIVEKTNPLKNKNGSEWNKDGFEYTENFDGKFENNNNIIYYNLKFVCDSGGSQTRTLREVNHFIEYQLEHIKKYNTTNIYFINILDGDTSFKAMDCFKNLIDNDKYKSIKKFIFCGDMSEFQRCWFNFHC